MSSKYQKNHSKPLLTIVEGGERTYIHPYSYYEDQRLPAKNSVKFLTTPEFSPHQQGQIDWLPPYQMGYIKRAWNTVRRVGAVLKITGLKPSGLRLFSIMWDCVVPIYCADIYRGPTITTPGTLTPSHAGSKLTDSYYLIPSQEWLKKKLEDWLNKMPSVKPSWYDPFNSYFEEERNSYLTWATEQVKMGRKIAFLSSLDT
jgi:hypothetical protein